MLAQLREHGEAIERAGARIACVVQAKPEDVAALCGSDLTCIPDPEHASYGPMGLRNASLLKVLFSKDLWRRRSHAVDAGFRQDWKRTFAKESAGLLLPGAAIIGQGGEILWLHRGSHTGDLPSGRDFVEIVARALAG